VRKHGKPVVVMEPVKGGALANPIPGVKAVFDEAGGGMSYASWAIRFAASLEGVITVLSGMSSLEQARDNIGYMKNFAPLSGDEYATVAKAQKALADMPSVPCTACDYCVAGCPNSIVIPKIMEALNRELVYNDPGAAKFGYSWDVKFGGKASDCIECGKCEEVCPQQINIIEQLKLAAGKYE
jgi:predicted aldo/keto reductase-like oxidoreductase